MYDKSNGMSRGKFDLSNEMLEFIGISRYADREVKLLLFGPLGAGPGIVSGWEPWYYPHNGGEAKR